MKNRYLNTLLLGIIAVLIAIFVLGYFNIISLPQKSVVTKQIDSTKETNQQNSNKEKQESKRTMSWL